MKRTELKLRSGKTLHQLHNGEGRVFGYFEVLPSGKAVVWNQACRLQLSATIFPGPISVMRALATGADETRPEWSPRCVVCNRPIGEEGAVDNEAGEAWCSQHSGPV